MRKLFYGLWIRQGFVKWEQRLYVFETEEAAKNWLSIEDPGYLFITREILKNRRRAVKLIGRYNVEEAECYSKLNEEIYGGNK